jgi:hypothetical protein
MLLPIWAEIPGSGVLRPAAMPIFSTYIEVTGGSLASMPKLPS